MKSHRASTNLFWIVAAALGFRLLFLPAFVSAPPVGDEEQYVAIAHNLAQSGQFSLDGTEPTIRRPPLYPLFLSPFASHLAGARATQIILDSTTCLFIFGIALALFKEKNLALGASALYALHPVFAAYSVRLLSETLFFWTWGAGLWLILKSTEPDSPAWTAPVAGIAIGLATLTRPIPSLFPIALLALPLAHRRAPRLWRTTGLVLLFSGLTLTPWLGRNHKLTGEWSLASGGGMSFWIGAQVGGYPDYLSKVEEFTVDRTYDEADAEFYRLAQQDYKDRWPKILAEIPHRMAHFWLTSHSSLFGIDRPVSEYRQENRLAPIAFRAALWTLHLTVLLLALLGFLTSARPWGIGHTLAVLVFFYYNLHIFNDYGPNRYHLPALMMALPFVSYGLLFLSKRIRLGLTSPG